MQNIYSSLRLGARCHQFNYSLLVKTTQAIAKTLASTPRGSVDKYVQAAKANGLNGLRLGSSLTGEPATDLIVTCMLADVPFSFIGQPALVALPYLPVLAAWQAVAILSVLVGTGTKPNFVKEDSATAVKATGILCQYGLVGLGEFAALKGADSYYAKQHNFAARACMVAACLFAVILEPIRGALALLFFVCQLPFVTGTAMLCAAIGVGLASLSRSNNPMEYTFWMDDVPVIINAFSEQKSLNDLIDDKKPYFAALKAAAERRGTEGRQAVLRQLELRSSSPEFTATIKEMADRLQKEIIRPENMRDLNQIRNSGSRLLCSSDDTRSVGAQYRVQTRYIHPDSISKGAQSVSPEVATLASETFRTLTNAYELHNKVGISPNHEPGTLNTEIQKVATAPLAVLPSIAT